MEYYKNKSLENIVDLIDGVTITEEWKDIEGYEGLYMVSNFGRVKSLERMIYFKDGRYRKTKDRIIHQQVNFGYFIVKIHYNSKEDTRFAHRLVAEAFIPNPENKRTVNHKKGIKTDNRVWLLEWNTHKENSEHAFKVLGVKVKPHEGVKGFKNKRSKPIICINTKEIFGSIGEAALSLGIKNEKSISDVINGKCKTAKGLTFMLLSNYTGNEKVEDINSHLLSTKERVGNKNPRFGKFGFDSVNGKIVLNADTGIFYGCVREAAEASGIVYSTLRSMLNGRYLNKTSFLYA